jgi:amidase
VLGEEVAFAGLAGQVELVRRGEVSARELVELALRRIGRLDPQINAFGAVYEERALREAAEADARVAAEDWAPLLGVPVAVKDEIDIGGEITSHGTGAVVTPAAADADVVRRLRAAGAIVVGKTKMPELGLWPFTESVTWGVTRSPWDLERTPGGSSGGSAAAVTAGLVPAALGGDGAGSIRIPAACCGLFGLKPQRDRVSRAPHDRDGGHWIVFGALTRSVLDSGVMLDVLAGEEECGSARAAQSPPGRLRIAIADEFPLGTRGRLSDEVGTALDAAADLLSSLGHTLSWRSAVATLAELPHAHAKLSAFSLLGTPRGRQRLQPVVEALLELFGAHRCMFGSNFPVERLAGGYTPLYELLLDILDQLPADQRANVLSETARRFYRLSAQRTSAIASP